MENFSSSPARYFCLKSALEKACDGAPGTLKTGTSTTCSLADKPLSDAGLPWQIKIHLCQRPDFAFFNTECN
ncbi:MAG: hypothetical protein GQF41_1004 [Candidatus Rifleibacterium amylolyticum]|nr:MAG: hypothetical protein GQF41_1004 [Candidatus Rifleibacterium amylolyticum]